MSMATNGPHGVGAGGQQAWRVRSFAFEEVTDPWDVQRTIRTAVDTIVQTM
ncbi:MAG: hypothetical protein HYS05_19835 [Acidobacteria bacterium]|nr:hypothetical protein [Acidobacteriota bacterium]